MFAFYKNTGLIQEVEIKIKGENESIVFRPKRTSKPLVIVSNDQLFETKKEANTFRKSVGIQVGDLVGIFKNDYIGWQTTYKFTGFTGVGQVVRTTAVWAEILYEGDITKVKRVSCVKVS
jgi:hypothetical protein